MKRILVVGGSRYFGKSLVRGVWEAGDEVVVLNRGASAPPAGVEHLVADRGDEERLRGALGAREFDVVVDQVCYTARQAEIARRVFAGRTGRYVMTSTMEVYDPATLPVPLARPVPLAEDALPFPLPAPAAGRRGDAYDYAEGKRQAEAVFLREPPFPYVSVRTAHVLGGGRAEFTGRLAHYVERIAAGEPVDVHEDPYATSFIHHQEIADLLRWAADGTFTGPVNAASHGALDVHALCRTVAGRLGSRQPRYRTVAPGETASPFSFDRPYAMDNGRATRLGFRFREVGDWLPGAVDEAVRGALA
ncbi:NAD-dependent epimerase/dehydratase family protein [Streptomyces sp. NPDC047014]|uniref:NAD-dependent epimerase/dehydratase family protein n=1 Tax=Streptomyces sp. NPDC047014 TaxID=3155736 RepID=UPI0033ED6628